jgi:hypothetical protein
MVCHMQPEQVRCWSPLTAESGGPVAPRAARGGVGAAGPQGVLEAAAVGLWMVDGGWLVLNLR